MINLPIKPIKCGKMGTYECQIPMPINNRVRYIDYCISPIVAALNAANITTEASCCGHNKIDGTIILEEDVWLIITNREKAQKFIKENKLI